MSPASRHICRHLIHAAVQPIPRRGCRIPSTRCLKPIVSIRHFTSTIKYGEDAVPPKGSKATAKNAPVDPPIIDGEQLQTPAEPFTAAQLDPEDRAHYETLSKKEQVEYLAIQNHLRAIVESEELGEVTDGEISRIAREIDRNPASEDLRFVEQRDAQKLSQGFWAEDEEDEFGQVEDADDEVSDDMITSIAESELEVNREVREYARIAAWELPMLLELVKPFEKPDFAKTPLRFRYTTYMGESHPAQSKVVVRFNINSLAKASGLNNQQKVKLVKLLGVRYNPDSNEATVSSEKYENAAQNKRYLGDLVQSLVKEAKDPKETFEDIPLDFRHHKSKTQMQFPKHWRITYDHPKALTANKAVPQIAGVEASEETAAEKEPLPEYVLSRPAEPRLVDGRQILAQHVASKSMQPGLARPF